MPLELVRPLRNARIEAVEAQLTFAARGQEKPYAYVGTPPEGVPQSRGDFQVQAVTKENVRPVASEFSVDVEGLAMVHHASAVGDFWDEAQTLALGHPE